MRKKIRWYLFRTNIIVYIILCYNYNNYNTYIMVIIFRHNLYILFYILWIYILLEYIIVTLNNTLK